MTKSKLLQELKEAKKDLSKLRQLVISLGADPKQLSNKEPCSVCNLRTTLLKNGDNDTKKGLKTLIDNITVLQKQNSVKLRRLQIKYG